MLVLLVPPCGAARDPSQERDVDALHGSVHWGSRESEHPDSNGSLLHGHDGADQDVAGHGVADNGFGLALQRAAVCHKHADRHGVVRQDVDQLYVGRYLYFHI